MRGRSRACSSDLSKGENRERKVTSEPESEYAILGIVNGWQDRSERSPRSSATSHLKATSGRDRAPAQGQLFCPRSWRPQIIHIVEFSTANWKDAPNRETPGYDISNQARSPRPGKRGLHSLWACEILAMCRGASYGQHCPLLQILRPFSRRNHKLLPCRRASIGTDSPMRTAKTSTATATGSPLSHFLPASYCASAIAPRATLSHVHDALITSNVRQTTSNLTGKLSKI